jgi:hypothetical protein
MTKVPYTLTFKCFNDTITLKKETHALRLSDVMEMNRAIIINLFGEKAYDDYILLLGEEIYEKGNSRNVEIPQLY